MKAVLTFLVLCIGVSAQALVIPGLGHPYTEGRLLEIADGHEIAAGYAKSVTFRNGSLELTEEKLPCDDRSCSPVIEKTTFVITKEAPAGCGSVKYEAREKGTDLGRLIKLVDHSERTCDDYTGYLWEMTLQEPGAKPRKLFGGPEIDLDTKIQ